MTLSNIQTPPRPTEPIHCTATDSFSQWLASSGGSLAISTYQAGKVALVGWDGQQCTLLLRDFDKPLGLAVGGQRMALATRNAVYQLANAPLLAPDFSEGRGPVYDGLWLPRVAHFTGDLNVHDLAYGREGLWIINTRFCCLSVLSEDFSFVPRWRPPFLTETAPEDRCHLNGLAMLDGRPKYVTALGNTDAPGAWRANKAQGGLVLDVDTSEIVVRGLCMPHSPRWHDGRLWLLNSGLGELCLVDLPSGRVITVCQLPGYLRGLSFVGPYALIGMCQIREKHIFGGLPIQERCQNLLCGVAVVDIRTGQALGMFEFSSGVQELFEVQFLPGMRRAMILNPDKEAAKQAFTAPEFSYWLRPSNMIEDLSGPKGNSP